MMPPPFSLERFFSLMSLDLMGEEEKVPVFSVIRKCQDTSHVFTNVTKVHIFISYRNSLFYSKEMKYFDGSVYLS